MNEVDDISSSIQADVPKVPTSEETDELLAVAADVLEGVETDQDQELIEQSTTSITTAQKITDKKRKKEQDGSNDDEDEHGDDSPIVSAMSDEVRYLITQVTPSTETEQRLILALKGQIEFNQQLQREMLKMKNFVKKRKQTYKRKKKDNYAPKRPLSAYNMFIKDRFQQLSSENEAALKSADGTQLKRVAPHNLVAKTGSQWKTLSADQKAHYQKLADEDKKRYEMEMENYNAPEKLLADKKKAKNGYNLFFSAHVNQLKHTPEGVPTERGSVARMVGEAWKNLNEDQRDYYEKEATKQNTIEDAGREAELNIPVLQATGFIPPSGAQVSYQVAPPAGAVYYQHQMYTAAPQTLPPPPHVPNASHPGYQYYPNNPGGNNHP